MPNKHLSLKKLFHIKEIYNDQVNNNKQIKNDMMTRIEIAMSIPYLDINQYMFSEGSRFYHFDHIHYEDSAKE